MLADHVKFAKIVAAVAAYQSLCAAISGIRAEEFLLSQSTAEAYASLWYQLHHQSAFRDVVLLYEVVPVDFLEGAWSLAASSAI